MPNPTQNSLLDPAAMRPVLARSVEQTLEIMCFAEAVETAGDALPDRAVVAACVEVAGDLEGRFQLAADARAARLLAASFLARDGEPEDAEAGPVLCELANIICGSMLTRLDPGASFTLSEPCALQRPQRPAGQIELVFLVDGEALLWCAFAPGMR